MNRRRLLASTAGYGALAAVGDLSFLGGLAPVDAQEAKVGPEHVRFRPEIEPLVRLLEETPRERLLERVAEEVRRGASYRQLLAAVMLAGVRNVQPRPVGFKFHAVLVVNSAHLASLDSPDRDRWLPLFWAMDAFKGSQARDVAEGDWTMSTLPDSALPPPADARRRFVEAMDRWDEAGADAAVAQLARSAGAAEVYELFWRYGARDFRDIGHKAIYVANSWRTLQTIGWEHAEAVLRSLAYALLARGRVNPADADEEPDRPWRRNLERVREVPAGWQAGTPDRGTALELLAALRDGSADDACGTAVGLLKRGASAGSLWDGVFLSASEMLTRRPGILGIHCVTSANALRYASQASGNDETRLLMLLQAAAFMAMFRKSMELSGAPESPLDRLPPGELKASGAGAVEEIFAEVSRSQAEAARKTVAYLQAGGSAGELLTAARRLIFLKGSDSHDYKFSSAALEDYYHVSPALRPAYLAGCMFNLKGTAAADNPLIARTRGALGAS
jgi:hypothetical protein